MTKDNLIERLARESHKYWTDGKIEWDSESADIKEHEIKCAIKLLPIILEFIEGYIGGGRYKVITDEGFEFNCSSADIEQVFGKIKEDLTIDNKVQHN